MKRFWTDATVTLEAERHGIALDGRPVRTPGRSPLAVPSRALAQAIADEWMQVAETIDPRAMPLTGLANAVIDRIAVDPAAFAASLAVYAESDLLCYRAPEPEPLVERQARLWEPLLTWASARYDVHFERIVGIMHRPQPDATLDRLREATAAHDAFTLAALHPIVTLSGSLVAALALVERAANADIVWAAANCDEDWQIEQWGEDSLAAASRAARRRDFDAAVRFLALLAN